MKKTSQHIVKIDKRHVWHPFTQAQTAQEPIPIASGKGAVLYGEDGTEYLDLISSWWVNLHGHAHPGIAKAIADQAHTLEQVIFAGFTHAPAATLAERLTKILPGDLNRVFYSDDGSTAVEVSLKLAHQYWRNQGHPNKRRYIAFEGGYHGDTMGAMSVGAKSGFFDHWMDLMFHVDALPFPETWDGDQDVASKEAASLLALDEYLDLYGKDTAALIMEPLVQGAAGMRMCRPKFLKEVSKRLKEAGVLLIFDEVMTGFGRTGDLFACVKADVTPDLICLSKGLTGGFLPLSATVCRDELYDAFLDEDFEKAFAHGHSFTANPLGCAAALASMDITLSAETRVAWTDIEQKHRERLALLSQSAKFTHARHCGTIVAIDVISEEQGYTAEVGPKLKAFFTEKGLLIRPLGHVIYLLPPYCVSLDQLDRAYDTIEQAALEIL